MLKVRQLAKGAPEYLGDVFAPPPWPTTRHGQEPWITDGESVDTACDVTMGSDKRMKRIDCSALGRVEIDDWAPEDPGKEEVIPSLGD